MADSCSETCSLIATAWSTLSILRQPHAECMRCCLHSVADVDGNHVVARCFVGEDGKPASPVVASLAVLANGELLRKTSSGLSVMLGRGQLEAREGLHQASSAQAHLENFAEHFTCHLCICCYHPGTLWRKHYARSIAAVQQGMSSGEDGGMHAGGK